MIFETARLILRPWEDTDADSLFEYAKDPRVGPIAGWPVHTSAENSREIIRTVLSAPETYAVCLKENNIAIGSIGLFSPAQAHTTVEETELEIGYWIGVPFWGCGLIPEAVRRLQEHAFRDLGCSAMWCGYYDGNEKSKRCQEKCGFRYHHTEGNKPCTLMGDVRTEHYTRLTRAEFEACNPNERDKNRKHAVVYIHGKGGNAEEANHYKALFSEYKVFGFAYKAETPWAAQKEFSDYCQLILKEHSGIILIANSIGAYFAMTSLCRDYIQRAYFISPIADMEKLITDMLQWANVSEQELEAAGVIETQFGETLSWEYLSWVRTHPIHWNIPTAILYGSKDHLQSIDSIRAFANNTGAALTVMENGEHWFHTEAQMAFLDAWLRSQIQMLP